MDGEIREGKVKLERVRVKCEQRPKLYVGITDRNSKVGLQKERVRCD